MIKGIGAYVDDQNWLLNANIDTSAVTMTREEFDALPSLSEIVIVIPGESDA